MVKIEKKPGADWAIYYMDVVDGSTEWMDVFGCASPDEAIVEARLSLTINCKTDDEKDWFEILAVICRGVCIDLKSSATE